MPFNHYAKMKRILADYSDWYVARINQPTQASKFNGEITHYDYYYRLYDSKDQPIKFCKFQQLERFCKMMNIEAEELPISEKDRE